MTCRVKNNLKRFSLEHFFGQISTDSEALPSVCVPFCVAKTCAVRPVFAWVGELWAADPSSCPRGHKAKR